jgi:hypothetical protein
MKAIIFSCLFIIATHTHSQVYNYYFGNLHAHTAFSDGNKDSTSSGVSKPDGSYAYAKLSNNFDFLGISEHNHYSSARNPGFKKPLYQTGIAMANAANQEGSFLALYGMEYGVSSAYHGHIISYGFNQLIGWETAVPGVTGNNYDVFNGKDDYDGIFKKIKNNPGAFGYLAHPWYSDYSPDGSSTGGLGNSPYNATYDSAIVGMPLRNGIATSSLADYTDYSQGDYFDIYRKLLAIGYHLGIGYDHDTHYTNFGRSNGGRLVILAASLTRANLMTAMQQMRFYGSDDPNAKVDFKLNGNVMGSILSGTNFPVINLIHDDPDGEQADSIKIWRGVGNNSFFNWATVVYTTLQNNTATFIDNNILPGVEYHYFVEIKQADGQRIVTSPVWYTKAATVSLKEQDERFYFDCFPNPVSRQLNLSMSRCGPHNCVITDLTGRPLITEIVETQQGSIDIAGLTKGIYLLNVGSGPLLICKKLVVE